jgi:LPXTG-motif cell wall-anchored protein
LPWIIGGIALVIILIIVGFFLSRKRKK